MDVNSHQSSMSTLSCLAHRAFDAYVEALEVVPEVVVRPAMPILFFGDVDRYRQSQRRIVTVGLNPSLIEFPTDAPFRRFPQTSVRRPDAEPPDVEMYLTALSAYFRTDPYRKWFRSYAGLLEGLDASFYDGHPNTALHTDICTPVPTSPTWSGLNHKVRDMLLRAGRPLWHDLIRELRPHVMLISVARHHLDGLALDHIDEWTEMHRIERAKPYVVTLRRYRLDADATTVAVFGAAAQTPFGLVGTADQRSIGVTVRQALDG